MITHIQQMPLPCFMQKHLTAEIERMRQIIAEINEMLDNLPTKWQMRYFADNYDLEIKCENLHYIAHRLEAWRDENSKVDEETFRKIQKATINAINKKYLQSAEGYFYDKES